MNTRVSMLIILSISILSGCISDEPYGPGLGETAFRPDQSVAAADNKSVLTIHLAVNDIYCTKTACECVHDVAARAYDDLQKQLKEKHNIDLQLSFFPEIYLLETPLAERKYDGVICKPWDAFRITTENRIRYKRVADLLDPNDNQWLEGLFMVRNDSDINELSQLAGKRVVLGQYDAYEKFHLPMNMLQAARIEPATYIQKASCLEAVGELLDGNADAAVVSDYVMTASCVVDIANPEDFKIIAKTQKVPLTSVIVDMDRISQPEALRLQDALLSISGKDAPDSLMGNGFVQPANWTPRPFPRQHAQVL